VRNLSSHTFLGSQTHFEGKQRFLFSNPEQQTIIISIINDNSFLWFTTAAPLSRQPRCFSFGGFHALGDVENNKHGQASSELQMLSLQNAAATIQTNCVVGSFQSIDPSCVLD
jgi:hypothetical protein